MNTPTDVVIFCMIKTALFIADPHYPIHDKTTFKIAKQIAKERKPDYLCFLGDMFDADGISRFSPKDWLAGAYETEDEILNCKKEYYQPLLDVCGKTEVRYTLGNHEHRIDDWLEKLEAKKGRKAYLDWKDKFNLKKIFPEAKITPYNECQRIGKLYLTHGEFHNDGHTKKHALVYGENLLYGHLHTWDVKTISTKANNKIRSTYSMPCSQKFNPKWMKNKSSAWVNGLVFGYFLPNGNFQLVPILIIDGKAIFEGKIYSS